MLALHNAVQSEQVIKSECHLASFLLCWGIIRCFLSLHHLLFKYLDVFFCNLEIAVMKRHLELTLIYWQREPKPKKMSMPPKSYCKSIFLLPGCTHSALNDNYKHLPFAAAVIFHTRTVTKFLSGMHWLVLLVSIFDGYTLGEECKHMAKAEMGIGIACYSALFGYELLNTRPVNKLRWHTAS